MFIHSSIDRLAFMDLSILGDKGYFCNIFFSGLFEIDLKSLNCRLLKIIPADEVMGAFRHCGIDSDMHRHVIAPFFDSKLFVSDDASDKVIEIFKEKKAEYDLQGAFGNIRLIGEYAYLFPSKGSITKIYRVNLTMGEVDGKADLTSVVNEADLEISPAAFGEPYFGDEECAVIPCWQNAKVIKFMYDTLDWEIINIEGIRTAGVVSKHNGVYYIGDRETLTVYRIDNAWNAQKLNFCIDGLISTKGVRNLFFYDRNIYVFPVNANMILKYNIDNQETGCVKHIEMNYRKGIYEIGENVIKCCKQISEEEILYYSCCDGKIVKFNMKTEQFFERDAVVSQEDRLAIKKYMLNIMSGEIIHEEKNTGIGSYLYILG